MLNVSKVKDVIPEDRPAVLFIRHARRAPLSMSQMLSNEKISILPEGAAEARQLGVMLSSLNRPIVFFTSPLNRCVQTCEEIAKGMGFDAKSRELITPSQLLGDPSAYVIDADELGNIMREHDNPISFLRAWFRGDVPDHAILSPRVGSVKLLRWFVQLLKQPEHVASRAIVACVSHDLVITAFLASLFDHDFEQHGVVDYLDGAVLWMESSLLERSVGRSVHVKAFFSGTVRTLSI